MASKHGRKNICEECGINFIDVKTLKLHIKTKHENPSAIEPFPCEVCGFVLANFNLLQQHVKEHTPVKWNCQYCDFTAGDQESLQCHMVEGHEEIAILCNMAKQVDKLSDGFASFENFKSEISNVLKSLFDNQHILKQELFVIRNNQANNPPKPAATLPSSTGENGISSPLPPPPPAGPPAQLPPVPAPRRTPTAPTGGSWAPPSVRNAPAPKVTKPVQSEPPKMLYIGDSISANVDIGALEVATQAEFVKAKAYSSIEDRVSNVAKQAAKFPASNFTNVIPTELNKGKYQCLILQSGSVDITNLNTKDEPSNHIEYFKQETVRSAHNLFNAATNGLRMQPTLRKIVIMKQVPRYDPSNVDPLGLKPSLALLFNNTITGLWMDSPNKDKIFIGEHNVDCTGAIRESRYRHTKSGRYDGIHLYGSSGRKALTLSVLNILKAANVTSSDHDFNQS